MKACTKCGEMKPLNQFKREKRASDGRAARCKVCTCADYREQRARTLTAPWSDPTAVRHCSRCGQKKPVSEFSRRSDDRSKPRAFCKPCASTHSVARAREKRVAALLPGQTIRPVHPFRGDVKTCSACQVEKPASEFITSGGTKRARCRACLAATNRAYMRQHQEALRVAKAAAEGKRRAHKRNAPAVEDIDRVAIYARDNYTCYLCGRRLDPQAKKGHADAITLDHVIPLSRGGAHTADNLRVCCHRCNESKHDRLLSELPSASNSIPALK